jgi:hypothetical protein
MAPPAHASLLCADVPLHLPLPPAPALRVPVRVLNRREVKRATSPLRALRSSLDTSISLMRAQLAEAAATAATRRALAATTLSHAPPRATSAAPRATTASSKLGAAGEGGKHLMRYSCEEVSCWGVGWLWAVVWPVLPLGVVQEACLMRDCCCSPQPACAVCA